MNWEKELNEMANIIKKLGRAAGKKLQEDILVMCELKYGKNRNRIVRDFHYIPPVKDQVDRMKKLRELAEVVAICIDNFCPDSREKSLAFTKIEEAIMWANLSIVRNENVS